MSYRHRTEPLYHVQYYDRFAHKYLDIGDPFSTKHEADRQIQKAKKKGWSPAKVRIKRRTFPEDYDDRGVPLDFKSLFSDVKGKRR